LQIPYQKLRQLEICLQNLFIKNREERKSLDFTSGNVENYNKLFSIDELKRSLSKSHGTAIGPDIFIIKKIICTCNNTFL
jgi:hypothetical protein